MAVLFFYGGKITVVQLVLTIYNSIAIVRNYVKMNTYSKNQKFRG